MIRPTAAWLGCCNHYRFLNTHINQCHIIDKIVDPSGLGHRMKIKCIVCGFEKEVDNGIYLFKVGRFQAAARAATETEAAGYATSTHTGPDFTSEPEPEPANVADQYSHKLLSTPESMANI
jgi:hypothetical protein